MKSVHELSAVVYDLRVLTQLWCKRGTCGTLRKSMTNQLSHGNLLPDLSKVTLRRVFKTDQGWIMEAHGQNSAIWGKPNTRVTSRKVGTVSFVSIADEGRSCGTKTPERASKSKALGRRCHLVSSNLLSQPL